ncbi:GntR family transcriptional regulator [Botrimarina sp.]|uniref:GntR family transcriptional regulator n=1 Tax=Botrimarina sp. TaxID=2795802 RepID=UPI0032EDC236
MPKPTGLPVQAFRTSRYPVVQAIVDADVDATQTLSDRAGEQLMKKILSGAYPAGTPLNSSELAESLGVSRTPLAKALAKLTADGILVQPRKQPAIVSTAAVDWLQQTRRFRRLLEPDAAAWATGQFDQDALDDLWALSREAEPSPRHDWKGAAKFFDFAVHLCIAEFCGNEPLRVAIRKCLAYRRLAYAVSEPPEAGLKSDLEEHVAVLDAITRGDPAAAKRAMERHLDRAIQQNS